VNFRGRYIQLSRRAQIRLGVAFVAVVCSGANDVHAQAQKLRVAYYLIAWGLIGEPVPRVMTSGGAQKKNS
jgi:hypothetical protein